MNSLGIDKAPKDTRVVVAMSGGVDSSVVAAMLKEEGYDVVGITLQLYDHGAMLAKKGACCAGADIHDARKVAESLSIPHYVLNYESKFRESVMDDFVESYLAGETPIPCVKCNQSVKFRDLLGMARDLGADAMATGHYVRREVGKRGAELHKASDTQRDQSYFLFATTTEQLEFLRFPLGGMQSKKDTRALAERYGLAVKDKPDSQDICFVPSGNYAKVIEKLHPGAAEPGDVVHVDGRVLAGTKGIIHYTVGQRKGLGVTSGDPLYVVKLDAPAKRVIVGPKEALLARRVTVRDMNWLSEIPQEGAQVEVRMRSAQEPVVARAMVSGKNGAVAELMEPYAGIAPGQACVMYQGTRVIGGGWIASAT